MARIIPPGGLGQYNDTGIPLSLRYGDGTYGVDGTIGLAPFEFGPYKIDRQGLVSFSLYIVFSLTIIQRLAFLNANKVRSIFALKLSRNELSIAIVHNIYGYRYWYLRSYGSRFR